MGDDQNCAGISAQMALEPGHRFRIEMVGWFVEKQKVRLLEKQSAERYAAALAAGEFCDTGSSGGQPSASIAYRHVARGRRGRLKMFETQSSHVLCSTT